MTSEAIAAPIASIRYAGVGLRLVALIIDVIIIGIINWLIAVATGSTTSSGFELTGIPALISIVIGIAYWLCFEVLAGGTPGKLAIGLRVRTEDGASISWGQSIVRNILRIVDAIPYFIPYLLGAILIWNSDRKQRLGDRVAKTVVVRV